MENHDLGTKEKNRFFSTQIVHTISRNIADGTRRVMKIQSPQDTSILRSEAVIITEKWIGHAGKPRAGRQGCPPSLQPHVHTSHPGTGARGGGGVE